MSENEEFEPISEEQFSELDFEEQLDYVALWMVNMMRTITALAEEVQRQETRRREYGNVIGKVEKAFPVLKQDRATNNLVKDVLKGRVDFYGQRESLRWVV